MRTTLVHEDDGTELAGYSCPKCGGTTIELCVIRQGVSTWHDVETTTLRWDGLDVVSYRGEERDGEVWDRLRCGGCHIEIEDRSPSCMDRSEERV
jgi:hypothetical protein